MNLKYQGLGGKSRRKQSRRSLLLRLKVIASTKESIVFTICLLLTMKWEK